MSISSATPQPVLALRQVPHEGLGALGDILQRIGLKYRYVDLFDETAPQVNLDRGSGLVVLGGPMNVDQTEQWPFLASEVQWLREAVEREMPVLGICLGAQLLAKSLGARVFANHTKEIGWYPLELTAEAGDDPLFAGCPARQTVFQWHGDTFDLPDGAVHLARSPLCNHQAFRFGNRAWGLQFHLEVTAAMIEDWLRQPDNACEVASLDAIDPAEIRAATPHEIPRLHELGKRIFHRFGSFCLEYAARK